MDQKYKIKTRPVEHGYHEGLVMLGESVVETTEYAYLDPQDAKNEARQVVTWLKKETNEP